MRYYIYAIENKINGKSYVGRTKDFVGRWSGHKSSNPRTLLGKDIKSLGLSNFTYRILDTADSLQEAGAKERLYTHLLESNTPEFGYNSPGLYIWHIAERNIDRWLVTKGRIPSNNIQPLRSKRNG